MILIILTLLVCVSAKNFPPEITKCRKSDPNLSKCLEKTVPDVMSKFAAGNKELGVVPLEPLTIPKIDIGNSSSVSVHQLYENMKLWGLTHNTMFDTEANFSDGNCYWRFKSKTDKVVMAADYKITGHVLVFPINGHGKCNNTLYDVHTEYDHKCEKYFKNNKKHTRVTHLVFKNVPKRVVFDFENIIDGNEQLSREVLKSLNENSLAVYADVGYAIDEALTKVWLTTINQVYSKWSDDELFLP